MTTDHAYDDQGNVWADVTTSDVVVMRYIRAASTSQLLAQIDASGNLSWYLTDNQGSVRDIVNAAGTTLTDHIDYGAFGNITLETNAAATGRAYLYTGLAEDRDTGIVEAAHRTLLVTTGQWMEDDPIAFQAGDANLRRYVKNNPGNEKDPTGLFEDDYISYDPQPSQPGGNVISAIGNIIYNMGSSIYSSAVSTLEFVTDILTPGVWNGTSQPTNPTFNGYLNGKIGYWSSWLTLTHDVGSTTLLLMQTYEIVASAVSKAAGGITNEAALLKSCFPAGTLVSTLAGLQAIEAVEVGSEVWAYDHVASQWRPCRVLQTFCTPHEGRTAFVTVADETIEATFRHPFWVIRGADLESRPRLEHLPSVPKGSTTPGRWVDAGDLREGDEVLLRDLRTSEVRSVHYRTFAGTVYNILVEDLHSYAVGRSGVLVHNENGSPTGIVAENGVTITGFTRHGVDRAIGDGAKRAGVKPVSILEALKFPSNLKSGTDQLGRPFQIFYGPNARVVINPQTGRIVSVNPLTPTL